MTIVAAADPAALAHAADTLRSGQPVVVPTDTVYGLVARADDTEAVRTIFEWKERPDQQVMAVLVASRAQAEELGQFTPLAGRLARAFWPGPLTLVVDQQPGITLSLGPPSTTVGLRWPAAAFACALADEVGPLTATSANRHGEAPATTAPAVAEQLGRHGAVIIDGGALDGAASTVVDARGPDPQMLRIGPLTEWDVRAAARG
ncbi:MAG: L-threonylcarbamoyladenylate synthase [Acidimicrobiales bacterium]